MTHTYQITGMTCGSCVARVKSELLKLGDVLSAHVSLQTPQATIEMSHHIATGILQEAIKKAGKYQINEINVSAGITVRDNANAVVEKTSYFPIFLIFGYITLISVLVQVLRGSFSWFQWMSHFMAGFFFIFSFFKFLNLKGFAEGYRVYDIVAKKIPVWGYIYPFVEFSFAILLFTGFDPIITNILIFIVMLISCIGVFQSIVQKKPFQCACLGTIIKLPLSKLTLVEDLVMVGMSLAMIIAML